MQRSETDVSTYSITAGSQSGCVVTLRETSSPKSKLVATQKASNSWHV